MKKQRYDPEHLAGLSEADKITIKKIEILTDAVSRVYPTTKHLIWRSFVQGIFVGLGTTIGVAAVVGTISFIFAQLHDVPILGPLVEKTKVQNLLPEKK